MILSPIFTVLLRVISGSLSEKFIHYVHQVHSCFCLAAVPLCTFVPLVCKRIFPLNSLPAAAKRNVNTVLRVNQNCQAAGWENQKNWLHIEPRGPNLSDVNMATMDALNSLIKFGFELLFQNI